MKFKYAIIDCDPIVYKCGFSIEEYNKELDIVTVEPLKNGIYNVNSMMKKILRMTECDDYFGYLTSNDKSNFRFELFPEYKANRKNSKKPVYYNEIRDYLMNTWKASLIFGEEADDACSIKHCELTPIWDKEDTTSIVCSFDKDFNNIPGWHYNFTKEDIYYVSPIDALRNFYLQLLTGDTSDGIPRIKSRWNKKKTEEKLKEAENEAEMIYIVSREINRVINESDYCHLDQTKDLIEQRGRLVWLRRKQGELWSIPRI